MFIFPVPRPGIEPGPSVPKTDVISVSPSGASLHSTVQDQKNQILLPFLCVFSFCVVVDNMGDTGDKGQETLKSP